MVDVGHGQLPFALGRGEKSEFDELTPTIPTPGWYHGIVRRLGEGRVAIFGEAAMFTSQITGAGSAMGIGHPEASENAQFAVNLLRWLAGRLD